MEWRCCVTHTDSNIIGQAMKFKSHANRASAKPNACTCFWYHVEEIILSCTFAQCLQNAFKTDSATGQWCPVRCCLAIRACTQGSQRNCMHNRKNISVGLASRLYEDVNRATLGRYLTMPNKVSPKIQPQLAPYRSRNMTAYINIYICLLRRSTHGCWTRRRADLRMYNATRPM